MRPATDGQYKAQVYLDDGGIELYLAQAGRFNVEGNVGWSEFDNLTEGGGIRAQMDLSHCQVQTLLGAIGATKGYDIWIPTYDRPSLDWSLTDQFECRPVAPYGYQSVGHIIQEVDVVWLAKGSSELKALFEVEHSTTIYSGHLRFNDVHLAAPDSSLWIGTCSNMLTRVAGRESNRIMGRLSLFLLIRQ